MMLSYSLPPRFLLPSWSSNELRRLARVPRIESSHLSPGACTAQQTRKTSSTSRPKTNRMVEPSSAAVSSAPDGPEAQTRPNETAADRPEWMTIFKSQLNESFGKKSLERRNSARRNWGPEPMVSNVAHTRTPWHLDQLASTDKGTVQAERSRDTVRKNQRENGNRFKTAKSQPQQGLADLISEEHPATHSTVPISNLENTSSLAHDLKDSVSRNDLECPTSESAPRSLFEELFPAESKQEKLRGGLDGALAFTNSEDLETLISQEPPWKKTTRRATLFSDFPKQRRSHSPTESSFDWSMKPQGVVLSIEGLSPSLSQSDFERMIPRGENVKQWRSPGEIFYVIPGRTQKYMGARPFYHLVFANVAMAQAYKANLEHVHALAMQYASLDQSASDIPKPGSYVRGENVGRLLHDYALCPPSQELNINLTIMPESIAALSELLQTKGYPVFENASKHPKSGRSVVVWIEGVGGVGEHGITIPNILRRDGFVRGQSWGAMGPNGDMVALAVEGMGDMSYKDWMAWVKRVKRWKNVASREAGAAIERNPDSSTKPLSTASTSSIQSQDEANLTSSSGTLPAIAGQPVSISGIETRSTDKTPGQELASVSATATRESSLSHRLLRRPQRWLLTFTDESEARRFVRRWHRRQLPSSLKANWEGCEMRAEFAW